MIIIAAYNVGGSVVNLYVIHRATLSTPSAGLTNCKPYILLWNILCVNYYLSKFVHFYLTVTEASVTDKIE